MDGWTISSFSISVSGLDTFSLDHHGSHYKMRIRINLRTALIIAIVAFKRSYDKFLFRLFFT